MYGKFFASTFTGSMFGSGTDVFALWGYVIANAVNGTVEVNPLFVSAVLGATPERVNVAMNVLCSPDAASRSGAENGRRLCHEGAFQYRVVNHAHYRMMRNEDDRRGYNREAKRRERAKHQQKGVSSDMSLTVNDSQACQPIQKQKQKQSTEEKKNKNMSGEPDGFDAFWESYPRKEARKDAIKAYRTLAPDVVLQAAMAVAIANQKRGDQWTRGIYPLPATWIRGERWTDIAPSLFGGSTAYSRTAGNDAALSAVVARLKGTT